jgi:hypothetical protein
MYYTIYIRSLQTCNNNDVFYRAKAASCHTYFGQLIFQYLLLVCMATANTNFAELFLIKKFMFISHDQFTYLLSFAIISDNVRYHSGGSMKLNACNLLLAHMFYL